MMTKVENKKKKPEQQLSTNVIYVGQLPEHTEENDIKKNSFRNQLKSN